MPLLNFTRTPLVRLLIAWVTIFTFLIIYGKAHFFRDPGSIFYDPDRAFVRHYTNFRMKQVAEFIHQHDQQTLANAVKGSKRSSICVHFATTKRDEQQYVDVSHTA
jgi:hypothetical protein